VTLKDQNNQQQIHNQLDYHLLYHPFINPIVNPADILSVNGMPKSVIANEEAVADLWVKLMTNLVVENLLLLAVILVAV
jgi:hypothetical protein